MARSPIKWRIGDRAWAPWYQRSFPYGVGGYSRCRVTALRPKVGRVVVTVDFGRLGMDRGEREVESFELTKRPGWHSWGWHTACRPPI